MSLKNNNHASDFLNLTLKSKKIFHSYVFVGPTDSDKKTVATSFVKSFFCQNESQSPCQDCSSCRGIDKDEYKNFFKLSSTPIKSEQLRNVLKKFHLKDEEIRFCLIDEYEDLTLPTRQSILKILEEPPSNICFIILTSNESKVLKTILSRSIVLRFNRFHEQEEELFHRTEKDVLRISSMKVKDKFETASRVAKENDLEEYLSNLISFFRKSLQNSYYENGTDDLRYSTDAKTRIIINLLAAKSLLKKNINKKILLENLFLNL